MAYYKCQRCNKIIELSNINARKPSDKYYTLCSKCIKYYDFISKTDCKKRYMLTDSDIEEYNILYFENPKNKISLYNRKEILLVAANKHGGLDKLKNILELREHKTKLKNEKNKKIKEERKHKIIKEFRDNKLKFKYIGDSYSYINYGTPSINSIIQNEFEKINKRKVRFNKLAKELNKINIPLDESIETCHNYINNIGHLSLKTSIKEIEIEYFLINNTKYLEYKKEYSKDKSRDLALNDYMKDNNKDLPNIIKKPIILKFN
jgi:hypothetical protein